MDYKFRKFELERRKVFWVTEGIMDRLKIILPMEHLSVNLLNPTGHVMHQQINIQQLYVLPTLDLCVLYLSENKQRLVPLTA